MEKEILAESKILETPKKGEGKVASDKESLVKKVKPVKVDDDFWKLDSDPEDSVHGHAQEQQHGCPEAGLQTSKDNPEPSV